MTLQKYKWLTLLTCIGMFVVLIAGVLVTNTESQAGCGTDWPLCNGKFIPAYTLESMVEYSHRMVSGAVGLLVGASFLATVLWKPAKRKEPLWYVSGSLFFTILQAALGAMAVVWQQSKAVLALHFGISMFAFTCTWLHYGWAARAASEHGKSPAVRTSRPGQSLSRSVFWFSLVTVIYCYGVVYLGAYIRHTGSGGACAGWPLCNGEVIPSAGGQAVAIAFAHRAAALLLLAVTAALVFYVRRRADAGSDAMRSARLAIVLVCLQILSGGLLVSTIGDHNLYVFTGLLHTIIISALFSVLCQLTLRTRNFFDS